VKDPTKVEVKNKNL